MKRTLFVSRHRMTECPSCHAHVRVAGDVLAQACTFCGARLNAPKRDVFSRLLDLGGTSGGVVAAMLGLGLVRCNDAPITDLAPDTGDQMVVPLYGIPPVDSGLPDATVADAREPLPQPEYGAPPVDAGDPIPGPLYGISPIDSGVSDSGAQVVDATEPLPEPDYGIPPIFEDAAVGSDAEDIPVPLYGAAPVDAGGGTRRDAGGGGGRRDGGGRLDAEDTPPVPLYGIAPVDAGQAEDASEEIPVPLYGGAAVAQPSDEILS